MVSIRSCLCLPIPIACTFKISYLNCLQATEAALWNFQYLKIRKVLKSILFPLKGMVQFSKICIGHLSDTLSLAIMDTTQPSSLMFYMIRNQKAIHIFTKFIILILRNLKQRPMQYRE